MTLAKRIFSLILCFCLLAPCLTVSAAETQKAADLSKTKYITDYSGFSSCKFFFDGVVLYGKKTSGNASFTAENSEGIGSIYILFQEEYGPYTVTNNDTGTSCTVGEGYFLHDFLDMQKLFGTIPTSVTVEFPNGSVYINEVYMYGPGEVPDTVQQWDMPADDQTDLILFSTHGDDEHLFFAGILPYYAAELGYQVQVVYLTDHTCDSPFRIHEMLNGLWAVGVTTYPVFGEYDDFRPKTLEEGYAEFESRGWTKEEMVGFVVEQIRRFNPLVVATHDFAGEYGHGQHMVYADLVAEALEITMDEAQYPESAENYGTWDVQKAYFHLYEENQITMDWDQPLETFDGETAFEVSIWRGFQCHETQVKDFQWFYRGCDTAAEVPKYNPCYYGLYRTTVGLDVEKNDFFENVTSHEELDRIAEEARLAEEAERQRLEEEEARKASEAAKQAAAEEALRQAAEQNRKEAEAQKLAEQKEQEHTQKFLIAIMCALAGLTLVLIFVLVKLLRKPKKRRKASKYSKTHTGKK